MEFDYTESCVCPICGKTHKPTFNNNPMIRNPACLECVAAQLSVENIEHADFFCRTYNVPFEPAMWLKVYETIVKEMKLGPVDMFRTYAETALAEKENHPNLQYAGSTKDLWARTNKEWAKLRSFEEIYEKLQPFKESYLLRGRLKWGSQYSFEQLLKLQSLYVRTLRANNITNPMQKEAVKTLCQLQIELDDAMAMKDPRAIKDFSSAWSTFAKQADLETMINDTKTDDITTVAELYNFLEEQNWTMKFYDGFDRDEVDRTIKDLQETNRQLILGATGLESIFEEMLQKHMQSAEAEIADSAYDEVPMGDLLEINLPSEEIAYEADEEILDLKFVDETPDDSFKGVKRLDD